MKERSDSREQRRHERASMQTIVIAMLSSGESLTIGSITDISLGGVKFTYHELEMAPDDSPIQSMDLIADSHNLADIPCEYVWDETVDTVSDSQLTYLRQCGIQFGKLTPNQIFLLRGFINHMTSLGINGITSDNHIAYS
jgi:hypothetical protein